MNEPNHNEATIAAMKKVDQLVRRSALIFERARFGQVNRDDDAARVFFGEAEPSFEPFRKELPKYPLACCPGRRSQLLEHDEESRVHNGQWAFKRFRLLQRVAQVVLAVAIAAIVAGLVLSLGRFFSFDSVKWFTAVYAICLVVVPVTVLTGLIFVLVRLQPPAPKWFFFLDGMHRNIRCPGCEELFSSDQQVEDHETEGYHQAAAAQAAVRVASGQNMADAASFFSEMSLLQIKLAARYVAEFCYSLPFKCPRCELRFCSSCTGGPNLTEHMCPDCACPLDADGGPYPPLAGA